MTTTCTLKEFELLDGTLTQNLFIRLTPIIICVGLLGNILTTCVFIITDLKRQSVSILTITLAIVDSLVLLIPVSLLWLENVLKRELTDASPFWCRTHGKIIGFYY
jgi:growth hormone secretagogue receptor